MTILVTGGGQTVVPASILFGNGNQDVLVTPLEPLPDAAVMALTVSGVEDLAGLRGRQARGHAVFPC